MSFVCIAIFNTVAEKLKCKEWEKGFITRRTFARIFYKNRSNLFKVQHWKL